MSQPTYILAIESSCDDTSAAVLKNDLVLSNEVANQKVHEQYGGVVPELASRAHQKNIVPVLDQALTKANITPKQLHAIAFTSGPGLMGSLLVGTSFAKSLALSLNVPLIDVHHMQAHILAHFIEDGSPTPEFPFLCLTVSGGHTQIVKVSDYFDFEVLGETIDDAAGEAFDKTAKILGLPYPGGPVIQKLAETGDPERFQFSKPNIEGYNYSFSGFKTSILYAMQKEVKLNPNFVKENINDICASVQKSILDILFKKLEKAVNETGINRVAIAGGVSANTPLRDRLKAHKAWETFIPKFEYTTDNAAMIGITAYHKFLKQDFTDVSVTAKARMKL
jgi:N6-L-threonylcarbamoyladenine synthase